MSGHTCRPSLDPRRVAYCACGKPITPTAPHARNPALERDLTEAAARGQGVDPQPVITMAQVRAHPGPVRDLLTRRFDVEAHEELADTINYLCWWIEQLQLTQAEHPQLEDAMSHISRAHGAAIVAFNEVTRAVELLRR